MGSQISKIEPQNEVIRTDTVEHFIVFISCALRTLLHKDVVDHIIWIGCTSCPPSIWPICVGFQKDYRCLQSWNGGDVSYRGLTVGEDGQVVVVAKEFYHVYSTDGARSCHGRFIDAEGAVFDRDGKLFVADCGADCVKVFTPDHKLDFTFGYRGNGDGELIDPYGIAVSKDGLIIVSERGNSRISIFTSKGIFVTNFGKYGLSLLGVAVDNEDNILVADPGVMGIHVFNINGVFLRKMGGGLRYPMYIAVDRSGNIAVTEKEGCVRVFSFYDDYVTSFGDEEGLGQLKNPRGIAFNHNGTFIVSENLNRVLQFHPSFLPCNNGFGQ